MGFCELFTPRSPRKAIEASAEQLRTVREKRCDHADILVTTATASALPRLTPFAL
jgi:hypothetical protein